MKKEFKKEQNYPKEPKIKWVKKSRMWVKTEWINGKQILTWSSNKPK